VGEWQQNSWQPVQPAEPEPKSARKADSVKSDPVKSGPGSGQQKALSDKPESGSEPGGMSAGTGLRSVPVPMPVEGTVAPFRQHEPPLYEPPPSSLAASALDLTNALLVKQQEPPPVSGWRRWLYAASGRRLNLGNSTRDEREHRLSQQVDRHLVGCYRISVLSLKGGVGKTTTTAALGSMFADIRGDRVIAVDANPDRGTLSQKVPLQTPATVRNMLRDIDDLHRYSDVRGYTSQNSFRLEVLASDTDPAVSEAFSGEDYDRAVSLLERFYSIVLTDCGTGLMHSAMTNILEGSDALVVVSSSSVDGARSASATLDWLDAHGHRELVRSSVAVVNAVRPRAAKVDLVKVVEHFEQRCRQVVVIPFDPHLEEGAEVDLNRLKRGTRAAVLELAAAVASGFPSARPGGHLYR
jgi:MinD-like ATPase involved in chromosome partitioning or flagellar assembly